MSKTKNLTVAQLKYAFGLSPEKAVEYFKSLGVELSGDWQETFKVIQRHAFTVSGVMSMDVVNEFKAMLEKALDKGMSAAEFRKQLIELFQKRGWLGKEVNGKLITPWRLNNIYRTNTQTAYMEGRHIRAVENKAARPYVQFFSTLDNSTTPECKSLHLKVMRIDDPLLGLFLPPGHFQCRRRTATVSDFNLKKENLKVSTGKSLMGFRNAKGFEKKPGGWKPDLSKYPKELVEQFNNFMKEKK